MQSSNCKHQFAQWNNRVATVYAFLLFSNIISFRQTYSFTWKVGKKIQGMAYRRLLGEKKQLGGWTTTLFSSRLGVSKKPVRPESSGSGMTRLQPPPPPPKNEALSPELARGVASLDLRSSAHHLPGSTQFELDHHSSLDTIFELEDIHCQKSVEFTSVLKLCPDIKLEVDNVVPLCARSYCTFFRPISVGDFLLTCYQVILPSQRGTIANHSAAWKNSLSISLYENGEIVNLALDPRFSSKSWCARIDGSLCYEDIIEIVRDLQMLQDLSDVPLKLQA